MTGALPPLTSPSDRQQTETLTLKVMVSMTKTRSGKTPATSSTLEKYWTGSLTSRSSSNNLNFPMEKQDGTRK